MIYNRYVIVAPCFNEENVIDSFLSELELTFTKSDCYFIVIIVDDCSTDGTLDRLKGFKFNSENYILEILSLKYNVGHQGAIRQGLKFSSSLDAKGFIVMDSDGEDDPDAILDLVKMNNTDIVFVSRGRRKETFAFQTGYYFYKVLFKIISGNRINFGNYSMVSKNVLVSASSQNFDHYSAFLSKLKYKKEFIKFDRRKRIDGKSKMNMKSLVFHGLNSLLEYSEELLFFFIKILVVLLFIFTIYGGFVFYSYFISKQAQPGWTSNILLSLINSILITAGIIVLGLLIVSVRNRKKYQNDIYFKL